MNYAQPKPHARRMAGIAFVIALHVVILYALLSGIATNVVKIITTPISLGFIDGISTSHYKPLKDTIRIAWTVIRARFFW